MYLTKHRRYKVMRYFLIILFIVLVVLLWRHWCQKIVTEGSLFCVLIDDAESVYYKAIQNQQKTESSDMKEVAGKYIKLAYKADDVAVLFYEIELVLDNLKKRFEHLKRWEICFRGEDWDRILRYNQALSDLEKDITLDEWRLGVTRIWKNKKKKSFRG